MQNTLKKITFTALVVGLTLSFGCSGKNQSIPTPTQEPTELLNKNVDQQLQKMIERRKKFLGANPIYTQFIEQLELGRVHLVDHRPKEAYEVFDSLIGNRKYKKFPETQYLKYFLALSLYDMGVKYGSLLYFVDIIENQPLLPYTHDSLSKAIKIAQEVRDDELILYLASRIPANKVPVNLREEFRYFIAKSLYLKKKYGQSLKLLDAISHRNRLYLGAKYLQGAIYVDLGKYEKAIRHFQKVSNHKAPVNYYDEERIKAISNLALGRIFYEKRNYPLSVLYYKKINRETEFYPNAMYEASWALFKLHKFNEALSVLHSLHSPYIQQIFFTKSYLLKAAIFIEMCHYDRAVDTLSSVESDFINLAKQIDEMARRAKHPRQYYPLLKTDETNELGERHYRYRELFLLSASEKDFLNVHSYITSLRKEQDELESLKNKRAIAIARLIKIREKSLSDKASYMAGKTLLNTRQIIEEYLALKDLLKYEIVTAERKVIQRRTLKLAPPIYKNEELIQPEFTESLKETMIWWEVRGNEYWADEVGYYLYQLPTRCKEDKK